jgi:hypothetical protein
LTVEDTLAAFPQFGVAAQKSSLAVEKQISILTFMLSYRACGDEKVKKKENIEPAPAGEGSENLAIEAVGRAQTDNDYLVASVKKYYN